MKRIILVLAAVLVALPVLADGPTQTKRGATTRSLRGKTQAPVEVTAQLEPEAAKVQILIQSKASDVEVKIWGIDGLSVTSVQPELTTVTQLERGEAQNFDVAFTPGTGRSYLVVSVSGKFGGSKRSTVRSISIGTPTAEQQKSKAPVITDSQGHRIKLMPVKPQ